VDQRGVEPLTSPVRGARNGLRGGTPKPIYRHLAGETRNSATSMSVLETRCYRTFVGLHSKQTAEIKVATLPTIARRTLYPSRDHQLL
jgi:hypothetical protein